jgi:hypothetical protein
VLREIGELEAGSREKKNALLASLARSWHQRICPSRILEETCLNQTGLMAKRVWSLSQILMGLVRYRIRAAMAPWSRYKASDPPADQLASVTDICNYKCLSRLCARAPIERLAEDLREGVKEMLKEMENPPRQFTAAQERSDQAFLDDIETHILNAEQFVADGFQSNVARWEELLKNSPRQSLSFLSS